MSFRKCDKKEKEKLYCPCGSKRKLCPNYQKYGYDCVGIRFDPTTGEKQHAPWGFGYNPKLKYGPPSVVLGYSDDGITTKKWAKCNNVLDFWWL